MVFNLLFSGIVSTSNLVQKVTFNNLVPKVVDIRQFLCYYADNTKVPFLTMVRFDTERKVNAMCKVIGYCRISTKKQSIDRQVRNITAAYPDAQIVKEAFTGTKLDRPEWKKVMRLVKSGKVQTIVFDSVSRMSRNAEEGFQLYQELFNAGIELVFLKEAYINTATYKKSLENAVPMTGTNVDFILEGINKYLMSLAKEQITLAFAQAEKEVEDLHQRTKEGIETARLNGKQIGGVKGGKLNVKKAKKAKEIIRKHSKDFNGTLEDAEVIKLAEISRNTYYKYKKELKDEI